jgi:hypothetical protein
MRDNLLINFSDSKILELLLTNSFVTIMKLTKQYTWHPVEQ